MLKKRIIPTILLDGPGIVKGVRFDSWRRVGTLLPAVKVYVLRDVDELVIVDVAASPAARGPDLDLVRDAAAECSVPLTIGGGVTRLSQCRDLLRVGADKVLINTAAYDNPSFIRDASRAFGSQCVVAGVDVGEGNVCYAQCGRRRTDFSPVEWSRKLEELGAGEILLTSIERDGGMQGYAYDLIAEVSAAVGVPVIASGGAGGYPDMHAAILAGASAVAAASIFHFTERTPLEAKRYLARQGVAVRLGL